MSNHPDDLELSASEKVAVAELRHSGHRLPAALAIVIGRRSQPPPPGPAPTKPPDRGGWRKSPLVNEAEAETMVLPSLPLHEGSQECCQKGICHRCLDNGASHVVEDPDQMASYVVCWRCVKDMKRQIANPDGHDGVNSVGLDGLQVTPMTLQGLVNDRPVERR